MLERRTIFCEAPVSVTPGVQMVVLGVAGSVCALCRVGTSALPPPGPCRPRPLLSRELTAAANGVSSPHDSARPWFSRVT